ncbi:3alpha(or 20beta)-hydroxysteroid dehydrogenase [Saccharopolyspora shandongensis]|uniref:3alpha(Or 20beta)-hydroxysteroid dehydrogenase n=1 Tax=Saccharopolyspora shandongensis TaxID=418495 RepID=A0A1H3EML8_9PSEU|nr:glucose 1-dehydrogenase [Saccharopolyspora shandongensis]SDX79850.1 3alpha(or 20beta)-hydroxysteroid dehydrogenase [Saccharopolyspora shandongensis]
MRLADKVAIVTGAARGQGAATARRFVAEGAKVLLADVADEAGKELADELGPAAVYQHLDVGSEDDWVDAVRAARELGPVGVLVNNAGVLHFSELADTSLADYERVIRVNQIGTFLGMREVIPAMREAGGSIINVSSVEGLGGMPLLVAYSASKFAIRGMTKVAAMELGKLGIRVNSVHPGAIDTQMIAEAAGGPVPMEHVGKRVALGRVGQPEEIAALAVFLASDESSYCTGAEFTADGGATATHALA